MVPEEKSRGRISRRKGKEVAVRALKRVEVKLTEKAPKVTGLGHQESFDPRGMRFGAVGAIGGQVLLALASAFHPSGEHPADHAAVFSEYAQSTSWTTVHLVQWAGGVLMFLALAFLAHQIVNFGRSGAILGRIALGASITVAAIFTVLQAVDGVSLKMAVDAWADAAPERQAAAFSAAEAIRWTEIGLNAVGRFLQGVAVASVAIASAAVGLHGRTLAALGIVAGIGGAAGGLATAYTGFSTLVAEISMAPGFVQMFWLVATGIVMWRRGRASALQPSPQVA